VFEIDRERNRLTPLERRHLSDLGVHERNDLQEWLAARPDVLGEDLLIVQKEFEGFPHSRERLDLLALDKKGRLVVIENKIGDCTREIFSQAIPYAAYASLLTVDAIVSEYERYLRLSGQDGNAGERISAFLEAGSRSALDLNPNGAPRVFLVASDFTPSVLMTAEWLSNNGVPIECFKISALTRGTDQFLRCDRLFPFDSGRAEKGTGTSKNAKGPADRPTSENTRQTEFWKYLAPLLYEVGLLPERPKDPFYCLGMVETIVGHNRLCLRVGAKWARIDVSASVLHSDADQQVLRCLSSARGMLERGLKGATIKFTGGLNQVPVISVSKAFEISQERVWPEISLWMIENASKLIRILEESSRTRGALKGNR
jgi:hypothetical protein